MKIKTECWCGSKIEVESSSSSFVSSQFHKFIREHRGCMVYMLQPEPDYDSSITLPSPFALRRAMGESGGKP